MSDPLCLRWIFWCGALAACAPRPGTAPKPPRAPVESGQISSLPRWAHEPEPPRTDAKVVTSEMIEFPVGEFSRGSVDGLPDERPVRLIILSAFAIDRVEVDVGAYALCVAAGACAPAGRGPGCNAARLDRTRHPINCIAWAQADAYCRFVGKRLPSEAEWEKAARSTEPRQYAWGDQWPPPRGAGNFADLSASEARPYWTPIEGYRDGFADTAPVDAEGLRTAQGGQHFAGNVAEWVADFYDPKAYQAGPNRDPTGPKRGRTRAIRGSSFGHARTEDLRATRRAFYDPTEASQHFGVRCAKSS